MLLVDLPNVFRAGAALADVRLARRVLCNRAHQCGQDAHATETRADPRRRGETGERDSAAAGSNSRCSHDGLSREMRVSSLDVNCPKCGARAGVPCPVGLYGKLRFCIERWVDAQHKYLRATRGK